MRVPSNVTAIAEWSVDIPVRVDSSLNAAGAPSAPKIEKKKAVLFVLVRIADVVFVDWHDQVVVAYRRIAI